MSSEQADPELSESAQQINDLARLKKGADFRGGGRARPAGLHAVYHAGQDGVGQIERVLGVLRQRAREIGHVDFSVSQFDVSGFPLAPAAERQKRCRPTRRSRPSTKADRS